MSGSRRPDHLRLVEAEDARREVEARLPLESGGGGGDVGGMPPDDTRERVAVLEQIARSTDATLKELKDGARDLRDKQDRDFRILFGAIIASALGLAALMAKGFRWF